MNTKIGQPLFNQVIYGLQASLQSYHFICNKNSKYYDLYITTEETKTQQD